MKNEEQAKAAKQLATDLARFVNCFGYEADVKTFVEALSQEHRTVQQAATGVMLQWFAHLADLNEYRYDRRNEHAVTVAHRVRDTLRNEFGPLWMRMPLI